MPFKEFFGDNIGFESNNLIYVDYLRVSYLDQKPSDKTTTPPVASYNRPQSNSPNDLLSGGAGDKPIITITEPTLTRGFKQIAVQNIRIAGKATDRDGIQEVLINNQPAWLRPDGQFSLEAPLHLGDNEFTIVATDRYQQSTTNTFSIRREATSQE